MTPTNYANDDGVSSRHKLFRFASILSLCTYEYFIVKRQQNSEKQSTACACTSVSVWVISMSTKEKWHRLEAQRRKMRKNKRRFTRRHQCRLYCHCPLAFAHTQCDTTNKCHTNKNQKHIRFSFFAKRKIDEENEKKNGVCMFQTKLVSRGDSFVIKFYSSVLFCHCIAFTCGDEWRTAKRSKKTADVKRKVWKAWEERETEERERDKWFCKFCM